MAALSVTVEGRSTRHGDEDARKGAESDRLTAIQAINAYLHWQAKGDAKCGVGCVHVRVSKLKEDQLVLPTFTSSQVGLLTKYKPKGPYQKHLHLIILLLLDTGCRIDEALTLRVGDCDMDNLLLTVTGKGRKQRRIPFSFELRRKLVRYIRPERRATLRNSSRKEVRPAKRTEGCETSLPASGLCSTRTDAPRLPAYVRGQLPPEGRKRFSPSEGARPFNPGDDEEVRQPYDRGSTGRSSED